METKRDLATRQVEVKMEDYLGEGWRDATITADLSSLLMMGVVRFEVETLDEDPFDVDGFTYWLIVGPKYEDGFPIVFVTSTEAYVEDGRWDAYEVETLDCSSSDEPGDDIANALFFDDNPDGANLLEALIGTKCGPFEIRRPQAS